MHGRPILDCYRDALELCPDLTGELLVDFTIDDKGKPGDMVVTGAGLHPPVDACVSRTFARSSFPLLAPAP